MALTSGVKLPSGDTMPLLGLGTWTATDPQLVHDAIVKAIEVGYRHIDTAYYYRNEHIIGEALAECFQKGLVKREDLFIVTKLPSHGHNPDKVKHFLQQSLDSLKLSYVDLYLVHSAVGMKYVSDDKGFPTDADGNVLYEETDHVVLWKELEKMVDEGLTRNIGLSNFNSKQIQRIYDSARIKPANLQVECHLYLQQEKLFNFCKNLNISFTAYSPFGSPGAKDFIKTAFKAEIPDFPSILEDPVLLEVAKKYGKSASQILLRYLTERGIIVIPKSTNPARIEHNAQIFDITLTEEDMSKLKSADRGRRIFAMTDFFKDMDKQPTYPFNEEF